jgi:hypothetical protein
MPEATVPAPRSASGPRTNPGAGQTMHPARPVRQKNEAQPTRAPGHPVTGRWPLAGSARRSCSHPAATDALAATPAAWSDFTQRNAELAASLTQQ